MDPQAQGQVEAAFDAWLASIGMSRNSQVPYGQEAYLASQWESFLLSWGKTQGRFVTPGGVYQGPPGGSFEVPRLPTATRAPSMQNNAPRPAPSPAPPPVRFGDRSVGGVRF
jgi:hypothetical protein